MCSGSRNVTGEGSRKSSAGPGQRAGALSGPDSASALRCGSMRMKLAAAVLAAFSAAAAGCVSGGADAEQPAESTLPAEDVLGADADSDAENASGDDASAAGDPIETPATGEAALCGQISTQAFRAINAIVEADGMRLLDELIAEIPRPAQTDQPAFEDEDIADPGAFNEMVESARFAFRPWTTADLEWHKHACSIRGLVDAASDPAAEPTESCARWSKAATLLDEIEDEMPALSELQPLVAAVLVGATGQAAGGFAAHCPAQVRAPSTSAPASPESDDPGQAEPAG